MSDELKRCGNCGEVIPSDAPEGVCPQCVLLRATAGERFANVGAMVAAVDGSTTAVKKPWGFGTVFRRRWWVLLLGVLAGPVVGCAGAMLVAYLLPKEYYAQVRMEVAAPEGGVSGPAFIQTQIQVIQGEKVTGGVAEKLKLEQRWMKGRAEVIDELRDSIRVELIRGTDLLDVRVQRRDAEEAADIANTTWEVYRDLLHGLQGDGPEASRMMVRLHEKAEAPHRQASPTTWEVLMLGGGIGVLGALPFGILLMYGVHWMVRWK